MKTTTYIPGHEFQDEEGPMKRRKFIVSSGAVCISSLLARNLAAQALAATSAERFSWQGGELQFNFSIAGDRLRQHLILPSGIEAPQSNLQWSGVEVALLCSGEDSPDSGMKQSAGSPGQRLKFAAKEEQQNGAVKSLVLKHTDPILNLNIESHYE